MYEIRVYGIFESTFGSFKGLFVLIVYLFFWCSLAFLVDLAFFIMTTWQPCLRLYASLPSAGSPIYMYEHFLTKLGSSILQERIPKQLSRL